MKLTWVSGCINLFIQNKRLVVASSGTRTTTDLVNTPLCELLGVSLVGGTRYYTSVATKNIHLTRSDWTTENPAKHRILSIATHLVTLSQVPAGPNHHRLILRIYNDKCLMYEEAGPVFPGTCTLEAGTCTIYLEEYIC